MSNHSGASRPFADACSSFRRRAMRLEKAYWLLGNLRRFVGAFRFSTGFTPLWRDTPGSVESETPPFFAQKIRVGADLFFVIF